jgi:hypothetical protein
LPVNPYTCNNSRATTERDRYPGLSDAITTQQQITMAGTTANHHNPSSTRMSRSGFKFSPRVVLAAIITFLCFLNIYTGGSIELTSSGVGRAVDDFRLKHPEDTFSWDKRPNRTIIVDVLSVGSQKRHENQKRQIETFGSHKTIRNFFLADERVDSDRNCGDSLTIEDTFNISSFCVNKEWDDDNQWIMRLMKRHYITRERLEANPNPVGWLCAQARPLHALFQIQKHYQRQSLPDYMIIMDDDSYYNMNKFQKHFSLEGASRARAIAGCRIKFSLQFSGPFGGFGLIFSRSMLQNLMSPIDCSPLNTSDDLCGRLALNRIGEYPVFQKLTSGSLVEMMKVYADQSPYRDHNQWTTGYCLHSDWATGYLVSLLGQPMGTYNTHPRMRSVFNMRFNYDKSPLNICRYEGENCTAKSEACHYAQPDVMSKVFEEQRKLFPNGFGDKPGVIALGI